MSQAITHTPDEVVRMAPVTQAGNGICYAMIGRSHDASATDLERLVSAVPRTIAAALRPQGLLLRSAHVESGRRDLIADRYDVQLSDSAICHRDHTVGDSQYVFISTRLMEDSFAIAFEFFINIGHNFVDRDRRLAGVCRPGMEAGGGPGARRDFDGRL